ncbi:MAG TPA: hypothetical protein PK289_04140, partial [Bacteroidia bacterium]|nr:hypothetical protein [Bacteroidia bacterium]
MYKEDRRESYLENDHCRIWVTNGILIMEYKPGLVMNIDNARKMVSDRLKVSNGITRPLLLKARNFISMDRATMKFYKTKEVVQHVTCAAFILDSALGTLAGNIFLALEKPLVPTKIFKDEQKALEWLEKYKYLKKATFMSGLFY